MTGFVFGSLFSEAFLEGEATSSLVSSTTDVALGGHAYMIDWSAEIPLRHSSIPLLRAQQDSSDRPGEQSVNPEGLWRRAGSSWHIGAGQERFDGEDSNPFRFRVSTGFDIWTKHQLGLLKDTDQKISHAGTNQRLAVAGGHLYVTLGNTLRYTTDITPDTPVFTTVTGVPANDPSSICSNGFHIWTAHGASGIYRTTRGAATTASHITGTVSVVDFVKNRLMAVSGLGIHDCTALGMGGAPGALPAALFTHPNSDWTWIGFAESQSFIYAAGYSGDKSLIYSIAITADGTALATPTVAGALPDGEVIASVYGYLGRFLALGTNKGFRLALVGQDGGLVIGALIETSESVLCFEGQERFIWFGWSGYSASKTGLGRFSTAQFSDVDALTPAYASDLMVDSQTAAIQSVVTFQDLRVFTVSGIGVYAEHQTRLVPTATMETGTIAYGLAELKTALFVDIQYAPNGSDAGRIEPSFSTDGATFQSLGAYLTNGVFPSFVIGEQTGYEFELMIDVDRDSVDTTLGPFILSWLLRTQPRPSVQSTIVATVFIAPLVAPLEGGEIAYNTENELEFLRELNDSRSITTWQELNQAFSVILEDYEISIRRLVDSQGMHGYNASATLKLKRV